MSEDEARVERVARAIYEIEPFEEGGEYIDGFCVSPGGKLSWEQAVSRDAEFEGYMMPITKFAIDAARAAIAATAWQPIETLVGAQEIDLWCRNISQGSTDEARFPGMSKNDVGQWEDWRGYILELKWRPTHWMPPPEPPKA